VIGHLLSCVLYTAKIVKCSMVIFIHDWVIMTWLWVTMCAFKHRESFVVWGVRLFFFLQTQLIPFLCEFLFLETRTPKIAVSNSGGQDFKSRPADGLC
jgi:hypothetical protein